MSGVGGARDRSACAILAIYRIPSMGVFESKRVYQGKDAKMDYTKLLAECDEGKAIPPLADRARQLSKQVASVEDRILFERGDVERREADLASFKDAAAAKLATSTSAYREWQARFRKLTVDLATARDALAILENEISPKTKSALEVARGKLSQSLTALYLAARPRCQSRMAELISVVVEEHDVFFAACRRLHQAHGLAFAKPAFDNGIIVEHARFAHFGKRLLTSPMHYLAFSDPPAEAPPVDLPAPGVAPVDVPDGQAALGATISDAVDSLDAPDAPGSTRTPAPDAGAVPDDAPAAVQDAPGSETSAQEAPGATRGEPLDTQAAPEGDPEKSGTRLPTILTGNVADLDADAPPDAGGI